MLNLFKKFILKNQLFTHNDKLLVAVSGGVDSIVLVHLLAESGYKFDIAHVNFNLRGEDSTKDQEFVKNVAEKYQVRFHLLSVDTKLYKEEKKISTQVAAREIRYSWFEELMQNFNYHYLLTAHHLDDSLETVIYNLAKGTGLKGIKGISLKRGKIVRPLLFAGKNQILDYAKTSALTWQEDNSNNQNYYKRNFIRHNIVPLLYEINPSLITTYSQTYQNLIFANQIFQKNLEEIKSKALSKSDEYISIKLELIPITERDWLYYLVEPFGFNTVQVAQIWEHYPNQTGASYQSMSHTIWVDRNQLIITPRKENQYFEIEIKAPGTYTIGQNVYDIFFQNIEDFSFQRDKAIGQFDAAKLKFPFIIRSIKEGDRIKPLGMHGHKKISDILIDKKIPLPMKSMYFVIEVEQKIAWLQGLVISEEFKIQNDSKVVLIIKPKE
jgi:tRNA(Ile)-lysidine synthase